MNLVRGERMRRIAGWGFLILILGATAPTASTATSSPPNIQSFGYTILPNLQPTQTVVLQGGGQQTAVIGSVIRFHAVVQYPNPNVWTAGSATALNDPGGVPAYVTLDVGNLIVGLQLYPDSTHNLAGQGGITAPVPT